MSREVHVNARQLAFADAAGHSPAREIVKSAVPKQKLDCTQVLGSSVYQGCFCTSHRVGTISSGVKANFFNPLMHDSGVLPCGDMWGAFQPALE